MSERNSDDYLPDGPQPILAEEGAPLDAVEPDESDLGDVFVNVILPDEDRWMASWQRGTQQRRHLGGKVEVLAWARAQTASHYWIFTGDGYVQARWADVPRRSS
jgi:hypothetical protein